MARALPLLLLLIACAGPPAPAPVAAAAPPPSCAAHEDRFPALIGMREDAVRAALAGTPGMRAVRSGGPNAPMTMDFREDRVTLVVQGGRVTRITCG